MKKAASLKELSEKFEEVQGGWSSDTVFCATSNFFIAEQIVALRSELSALMMEKQSNRDILLELRALADVLSQMTRTKGRLHTRRQQLKKELKPGRTA